MKAVDIQRVGTAIDRPAGLDELRPGFGVVFGDELVVERFGEFVEQVAELHVETGLAVHTGIAPALGRLATARAGDRRERVRFLRFDLNAVGARNFAVTRFLKDGDIPRGDATAARPPVVLFEDRLVDAARGQITGRTLPEVGERDRLVNTGFVGRAPEDLSVELVADSLGFVEPGPQRRVAVVGVRVSAEPSLEVRDARDEWDGPLAGLPVDGDLESVRMVGDVADAQASKLARARPRVPRDGDHGRAARVARGLDHRNNVLIPVEHVGGVRRGLVVASRVRRDPLNALGDVVTLGDVFGEHSQRDAIVPVRFLVVVLVVNPSDDALAGVAVLKRGSEVANLFPDSDGAAQEVFVAVIAVARGEKEQSVGEVHERVRVGRREVSSSLNTLSEVVDSVAWVLCHAECECSRWDVNPGCETPPEHYPDGVITASNRQTAAGPSAGAERGAAA